MTDHHDEDATMPPTDTDATTHMPRVRRPDRGADRAAGTRIDPHGLYDIAAPTVRVSPIGAHTRGAAATTPPPRPEREKWQAAGRPPAWPDPATREAAATLDALLDDRARIAADTRRAWTGRPVFRVRRGKARTVREVAARRAAGRLRHERTMEILETIRMSVYVATAVALFLLVVGMAAVAYAILAGWMVWAPTRV